MPDTPTDFSEPVGRPARGEQRPISEWPGLDTWNGDFSSVPEGYVWTHDEANDDREVLNNHADWIEKQAKDITGVSEPWALGNTSRRSSIVDEHGVLVSYVALENASAAQIANIRPGTNALVWLAENFRSQVIGDGSSSSFNFNHGFSDGHVSVDIRNNESGDIEYPHVSNTGAVVTVNFAVAPPSNSYTIEVSR